MRVVPPKDTNEENICIVPPKDISGENMRGVPPKDTSEGDIYHPNEFGILVGILFHIYDQANDIFMF